MIGSMRLFYIEGPIIYRINIVSAKIRFNLILAENHGDLVYSSKHQDITHHRVKI